MRETLFVNLLFSRKGSKEEKNLNAEVGNLKIGKRVHYHCKIIMVFTGSGLLNLQNMSFNKESPGK